MIREILVKNYIAVCDDCGWTGHRGSRATMAERDLHDHKCGEHRETQDSGRYTWAGGIRRTCVCNATWVEHEDRVGEFVCPKDAKETTDEDTV